jgi:hypothetical protein
MGLKTIEAKRAEFNKMRKSMNDFIDAAEALRSSTEKYQKLGEEAMKALENHFAQKNKLLPEVKKLETFGVKAFEDYKKSLIAICENRSFEDRPLPTTPLQRALMQAQEDLDKELQAWIDKQPASMPKEIKKGMTFKDGHLNRIWEVISDPYPAKNARLQGDDAIIVTAKWSEPETGKSGQTEVSKTFLTTGKMKFLKL